MQGEHTETYIEKDGAHYVFSDIKVDNNQKGEQNLSPEQIAAIAETIYEHIKSTKYDNTNEKECEQVIVDLRHINDVFRQFSDTFPFIMNRMVAHKGYNRRVLKLFLDHYGKNIPKNDNDRIEMHAKYEFDCYKAENNTRSITPASLQGYRKHIKDTLIKEYDLRKRAAEEGAKQIQKERQERRERMMAQMMMTSKEKS